MLRPGTRVTRLTKRVGQRAPEGKILSIRGDSYEIRWDDGHMSIATRDGIVAAKKPKTD